MSVKVQFNPLSIALDTSFLGLNRYRITLGISLTGAHKVMTTYCIDIARLIAAAGQPCNSTFRGNTSERRSIHNVHQPYASLRQHSHVLRLQ